MRKRPAATCHPDREHYAKGLCKRCYSVAQRREHGTEYNANRKWKYKENPEKRRARNNKWYREHPEARILMWARRRAKKKGLSFNLTRKDIVIPDVCPVLGIPIIKGGTGGYLHRDGSPSLDRINSELGYEPANVAVISHRANQLKNAGTAEEHQKIADWMKSITRDS